MTTLHPAEDSPLGKINQYIDTYSPALLFPIARAVKWEELGFMAESLPYQGIDVWNAYELSWLTSSGKPAVMAAQFVIPADSPNIIESKSFKLYLNSFNQTIFPSVQAVQATLQKDLSVAAGKEIQVSLFSLNSLAAQGLVSLSGVCIDELDISISQYTHPDATLLRCCEQSVEETLYSHLLKSNCPVTGQPDWGSLVVEYQGERKLEPASLLKYLISFRCHADFHEQCVERIFIDINDLLKPEQLTVYANYVRRGGLDINPYRSLQAVNYPNGRLARQ